MIDHDTATATELRDAIFSDMQSRAPGVRLPPRVRWLVTRAAARHARSRDTFCRAAGLPPASAEALELLREACDIAEGMGPDLLEATRLWHAHIGLPGAA